MTGSTKPACGFIAIATAKRRNAGDLAPQRRRAREEQEQRQSTNTAGTASTWPQTALSAITAGLKSTAPRRRAAGPGSARRSEAGARRGANVPAIQASAEVGERSPAA